MSVDALIVFVVGWVFYRNPAKGQADDDLVLVTIPEYNQKNMIEIVVDAIYRSTYINIEAIAVNDRSNDGSKEVLVRWLVSIIQILRLFTKRMKAKENQYLQDFVHQKASILSL